MEIALQELEKSMKGWGKDLFTEWQKLPVTVTKATQDPVPVKVEAKVDGSPVKAELVAVETKASMGATGIAGIVESGDRFKILKFELGPITSAIVGLSVGAIGHKAINAWLPPYRDAAGVPTGVRPVSVGFGQVNWLNPAANLGGMVLVETYGANLIGRTAAHFIAGSLFVSSLLTYTPLGAWLDSLVVAISPKTGTVAQDRGRGSNAAQEARNAALRQRHLQEQSGSNGRRAMESLRWT